jgi:hypothetical protein
MNKHIHKISKYSPSIFQGRLNLAAASSRPHVALAVEYPAEKVVLRVLLGLLGGLALCYLYFVSASVLNVMAQKEAIAQAGKIESSIGKLEGRFFTLSQAITPQSAASLGLIPITATDYVDRPGNVGIADVSAAKQL